jgi:hypothetical protein
MKVTLSTKIKLTNTQISFIKEITEIKDTDEAVERFMEILMEENVDPLLIGNYVDKIMRKIRK